MVGEKIWGPHPQQSFSPSGVVTAFEKGEVYFHNSSKEQLGRCVGADSGP